MYKLSKATFSCLSLNRRYLLWIIKKTMITMQINLRTLAPKTLAIKTYFSVERMGAGALQRRNSPGRPPQRPMQHLGPLFLPLKGLDLSLRDPSPRVEACEVGTLKMTS